MSSLKHKEYIMEQRNCPYLGLIDDPTTLKDYPSEDNACHRVKKPVRILLEYQNSHCLCDTYRECPGYIDGWEDGFPVELRAGFDPSKLNLSHKFLLWKESLAKKNGQKEEHQEDRDWKEKLQNILPFSKQANQGEEQIKEESPKKKPEKIELREEPSPERKEEVKPTSKTEKLERVESKKILQDEGALQEYLKSKKKNPLKTHFPGKKKAKNKPDTEKAPQKEQPAKKKIKKKLDWKKTFYNILHWKKKSQQTVKDKEVLQDNQILKKEQKPKRNWKETLLRIIPWKKTPQQKDAAQQDLQSEKVLQKEQKQKKSLKQVLKSILPWKIEKKIKQDKQKAVQEEILSIEEVQPEMETPEVLPNEWVKEEEQFEEDKKEILQGELPQWEKDIIQNRQKESQKQTEGGKSTIESNQKGRLPDVMAWKNKQNHKRNWKEVLQSKLGLNIENQNKKRRKKDVKMEADRRDKKSDTGAWKKSFKDRRVWLVSLGIILIFLLVIFIPQLPSVNLNIRDRLGGLFNPPISTPTDTAGDTPTNGFEGITQTEAVTSKTTELAVITPIEEATPNPTPVPTNTATITSTPVPTPSRTPGPAPFIIITCTETPD